jgi:outer membrane protein TolC
LSVRLSYVSVRSFAVLVILLCSAVAAFPQADQTTEPPPSTPGEAIPGTLGVSPYGGSVPVKPEPGVVEISLQDAIARGLRQNLGALLASADIQSARGTRWAALSALLPHVTASPFIDESQINLAEFGFTFKLPGFALPASVGPFSYFDARFGVTQSVFNWQSINNERSSRQNLLSSEYAYRDARDLVVLAVGYTYLQGIADIARVETAQAQVDTAQALSDQASDQVTAGTSPQIDAMRAKVELQTRQQQLIQAKNNYSIQKLTIARVIGLAPGQQFELTDKSPYQPFEAITLEDALKRAYASRSDYRAAVAETRAAEYARKAARAGYLPSISFDGDYGTAGTHPSTSTQVFDIKGTLTIPIFEGGSTHAEVLQADAQLRQSREREENLRAQIDADVRTALFNLQSSADQVEVARSNISLANETLAQSRDRFAAGVTDSVEVVQSQELVASANEQFISSLYNFNFAKISLARAMGIGEEGVKEFFKGK